MNKVELTDYESFVASTISPASSNFEDLTIRLNALHSDGVALNVKIPELITASAGLTAEAGEFTEVVKKILFQGKPLNEENIFHMKRELGDICWYLAVAAAALGTSLDEIFVMNVEKLSARYPQGFEIIKSEIRVEGDV
jgi:NTP pyrophosphatase (non-canonical NTP hydrolase)